jgi:hypothetical protein
MNSDQDQPYRVAIADYKWKYILYALVCWGLVLAGFLAFNARERHWQFWMAEVVMLLFALGLCYMLFSPKYEFIGRKGPRFEAYLNQRYNDFLTDHGKFEYFEDGFVFQSEPDTVPVKWSEIQRVTAHLEDVVTNDEDICLKLEYGENHFLEFDEEIPGWLMFKEQLALHIGLAADWEARLLASGKKELLLFDANQSA